MIPSSPYIDFHTHSEWNGDDTIEVVSLDGNKLKSVRLYTIGYHPWWLADILTAEQVLFLKQKYENDKYCLGLGECGLDGLKGPSSSIQERAFLQQIELANSLNAPLVIHSVRAFDRVLCIKRKYGSTPWVIHGFVRNKILAQQVLDAGCFISVAPSQLMAPTFLQTLSYIPDDRIFIETDSDFRIGIRERYEILAEIRKCSVDELKQVIFSNFAKFYSEKWKYHSGLKEQNS